MADSARKLPVREANWTAEHTEQSLAQFHEKRQVTAQKHRTGLVVGSALVCAAAALLTFQFATSEAETDPSDTIAVTPPQPKTNTAERTVRFKDGSRAVLRTAQSQLEVTHASEDAISVELPEGSAEFHVVPSETRRFVVNARGIVVTVLGTEFSIRHEVARTHVQVAHGRVQVESSEPTRVLTAGEAAWFELRSAYVAAEEEPTEPERKKSPAYGKQKPTAPRLAPRERFLEAHRRAEYMKAYEVLSAHQAAVGQSPEDLMRAADAARYSGHPAEATGYLRKVEQSGGPLSSTASFTLGRLYLHQLGNPAQAADAFARARLGGVGGPLAEDALFREIEARSRAGQSARAKSLAKAYLGSYPQSRRKDSVKRWGGLP